MIKNAKKKGTRNEHRSMQRDRDAGAICLRAGASLGVFDYIALYPDYVRLVQVKTNRWPGHDEMRAIHEFPPLAYGKKVVERWDDYAREPKVKEVE
jgi:hypothetical protein